MLLQVIEGKFSVCKVENLRAVNFHVPWLFVGKTDAEISVVCLTADVPHATLAREDGWRALRVAGQMDFGLTGVMAGPLCWRRRASAFLPCPPLIRIIY